jgi:hypothetical protein
MSLVMWGVKGLSPGDVLLVKHRWEPQPFYDVWTGMGGLEWYAEFVDEREWWIWVWRKPG